MTYFIGKSAPVYEYFQLNEKYFATGSYTTIYVDNKDLDYDSEETQRQIIKFHKALYECPGCDEKWYVNGTLQSWYSKFNLWVKDGGC